MRKYLFADEAGDFEFARKPNVSRYFIVCTVTSNECELGHELLNLRRELAWTKHEHLKDYFHASEDKQEIRDLVFDLIRQADIRIDATIMEKSKAQPQTRTTPARFYQYGWFFHFKNIARGILQAEDELLLTAASIATKKAQAVFTATVNDVVQQVASSNSWATCFCPASVDPCLQVADYCTWAIQRKWERNDVRSYALISSKIVREYDLWSSGTRHYY
jgi:hypothetical protein